LEVLAEILKRVAKGDSYEEAIKRVPDLESEEECKRNRVFMAKYLNRLKTWCPLFNKTHV
jgi:hypothetical protein